MKDIKDIWISSCLPLYWYKDEIDISKLVYIGKKRVRHKCAGKMTYKNEYVYWYPELKPIGTGEYFRSSVLLK